MEDSALGGINILQGSLYGCMASMLERRSELVRFVDIDGWSDIPFSMPLKRHGEVHSSDTSGEVPANKGGGMLGIWM